MKRLNRLNLIFGIIFLAISLFFYFYPEYDIVIEKLFYDNKLGFIYSSNIFVKILFRSIPAITTLYCIALTIFLLTEYISKKKEAYKKSWLYSALLVSVIVSSGLIVNLGLKDNFGRARPKQVTEFGGQKEFTRVYEPSNQCRKNCSFSSGHAAAAFCFVSIAFLVPIKYQFLIFMMGIFFGLLVGLGRIAQGGHFASDVVSSGWIVLITNYIFIELYRAYVDLIDNKYKKNHLIRTI